MSTPEVTPAAGSQAPAATPAPAAPAAPVNTVVAARERSEEIRTEGANAIAAAMASFDSSHEETPADQSAVAVLAELEAATPGAPAQAAQPAAAPAAAKPAAPAAAQPAGDRGSQLDQLLSLLGGDDAGGEAPAGQANDGSAASGESAAEPPKPQATPSTPPKAPAKAAAAPAPGAISADAEEFAAYMADEFGAAAGAKARKFAAALEGKSGNIDKIIEERVQAALAPVRDIQLAHDPINVEIDTKFATTPQGKAMYGEGGWMRATEQQRQNRFAVARKFQELQTKAVSLGRTVDDKFASQIFEAAQHFVATKTKAGVETKTEVLNRTAAQRQGMRLAVPTRSGAGASGSASAPAVGANGKVDYAAAGGQVIAEVMKGFK